MDNQGMKFVISSDVSGLISGIKKAQITIGDLEVSIKELKRQLREASGDDILRLNNQIKGMEDALKSAKTAGLEPAVTGLGNVSKAANTAFSEIRKLAYILPGIGIAGIFGAAFGLAAEAISDFTGSLSKAADAQEHLNQILAKATGSVGGEAAQVQSLVNVIKDETQTRGLRLKAFKDLQDEYPNAFKNMSLEKTSIEEIEGAANKLTNALITQAKVKALLNEISDIEIKKNQLAANTSADQFSIFEKIKLTIATTLGGAKGLATEVGNIRSDKFQDLANESKLATDQLDKLQVELLKVQDVLGKKVAKPGKDDSLLPEVLITPKIALKSDLGGLDTIEFAKDIGDKLKHLSGLQLPKIEFTPHIEISNKQFAELQKQINEISGKLRSLLVNSIENVAEGLGAALSGGGFGAFINSFARTIGEGLKTVGKILIEASIKMAAVQKAAEALATANPVLGVVAGVAAIVAGTLIENLAQQNIKSTKFATGGIVTGPTLGLVGEAGPEVIFPLEKLNQFIRGANTNTNVNVGGQLRVQGTDLVTVINRQNKLNGLSS